MVKDLGYQNDFSITCQPPVIKTIEAYDTSRQPKQADWVAIMIKFALLAVGAWLLLTQCTERSPSTATFNVYFWHPNSNEQKYLGTVSGLAQCQAAAHGFARSLNMDRGDGWSYICCLKTSTNECAEKHR